MQFQVCQNQNSSYFDASFTTSVTLNQLSSPKDSLFESLWYLTLLSVLSNSASLIAMALKLVALPTGSLSSHLSHIIANTRLPKTYVALHYGKSNLCSVLFFTCITPFLIYSVHLLNQIDHHRGSKMTQRLGASLRRSTPHCVHIPLARTSQMARAGRKAG